MKTLRSAIYNFLAVLGCAAHCHKVMLFFVSKMLKENTAPNDTITWVLTIVGLPASLYKKHPTLVSCPLRKLVVHMDPNTTEFSYLLLGLVEDEQKHPVLLDVLSHTTPTRESQTFFISCVLHNQKIRSLAPSAQNNLYISLLKLWNVDFATNLNCINEHVERGAPFPSFSEPNRVVYNLFMCLARRAPPETFCFVLSKAPFIPLEYSYLHCLPSDKEVARSLVKYHPSFMFNVLSRYSKHPNWENTPLIPLAQEVLLEKSFPLLYQNYMEEARRFVALEERALIKKSLKTKPCGKSKTFKM